jgi:hypothetical protein
LDYIQVDSSEEEQVLSQPMEVEEAPKEDEPDVVVFDLYQDVTKAKLGHITQAPVNFKVKFTAKTKVCLVGLELLSRDFAANKWAKRY